MNKRWICDVRSGCVAVYFAEKPERCLSGAWDWAKVYFNGKHVPGGGWTISPIAVAWCKLCAWWLNAIGAKPKDIYS